MSDDMRGKLLCGICGRPLKDHNQIGPCPEAGEKGRVLLQVIDAIQNRPVTDICGDLKGTYSGYQKHLRKKQAACEPCKDAKREYQREYYHAKQKESSHA